MKKRSKRSEDMRPEYDFSHGVRAKYAARYRQGTNVVVLEADVAAAFPDSEAVNRALRAVLAAAPKRSRRSRRLNGPSDR